MDKGHKISLGGSYTGNLSDLFLNIAHEGILQFVNVGREFTLQVKSENFDEIVKSLEKQGVENVNILEWKKYGTTIASSGSSPDAGEILNVSLIPSALGSGLRPLSVNQKIEMDRKLYIEMLATIEAVLMDAGISDALYALQIDKEVSRSKYLEAIHESTLNALFNSGGVVGIE